MDGPLDKDNRHEKSSNLVLTLDLGHMLLNEELGVVQYCRSRLTERDLIEMMMVTQHLDSLLAEAFFTIK